MVLKKSDNFSVYCNGLVGLFFNQRHQRAETVEQEMRVYLVFQYLEFKFHFFFFLLFNPAASFFAVTG